MNSAGSAPWPTGRPRPSPPAHRDAGCTTWLRRLQAVRTSQGSSEGELCPSVQPPLHPSSDACDRRDHGSMWGLRPSGELLALRVPRSRRPFSASAPRCGGACRSGVAEAPHRPAPLASISPDEHRHSVRMTSVCLTALLRPGAAGVLFLIVHDANAVFCRHLAVLAPDPWRPHCASVRRQARAPL